MFCGSGLRRRCPRSGVATLAIVAIGALVMPAEWLHADGGSPGPLAQSCGVPATGANTAGGQPNAGNVLPQFRPGEYPVQLPPVSMLGARNDLPNPYRPGVSWGQLPEGRKWGSTASVSTGPDGTIWVVDRCGNSGAGGATCAGASANINPIFEFDTSGKLLKSFGAGMFVSPHKLSVDKEGNLWLADGHNGGGTATGNARIMKFDKDGKFTA